jgi:hypothetical protein
MPNGTIDPAMATEVPRISSCLEKKREKLHEGLDTGLGAFWP